MRLAIVLFIFLTIIMFIGTIIPQNQASQRYINLYGPTLAEILEWVQFTEIFHSYLFIILLTLFCANTLVCSLKRLKGLNRKLFSPRINVGKDFFGNLTIADEFTVSERDANHTIEQIRGYLTKRRYRVSHRNEESCEALLFQKGRWGRLGPEITHFSILAILIGGLIGGIFGFSTRMNIPEGKRLPIPGNDNYSIKLNDFSIDYYRDKFSLSLYEPEPEGRKYRFVKRVVIHSGEQKNYRGLALKVIPRNGEEDNSSNELSLEAKRAGETKIVDIVENNQMIVLPGDYGAIFSYYVKQYSSQVEIIDDRGKMVSKHTIQVNHPLKYGGVSFYQQRYKEGATEVYDADWVVLEAYSGSDNKLLWQKEVEIGQKIKVGKNLFVTPTKFFPSLVVDEKGKVINSSSVLNNPAVFLQFSERESDDSTPSQLDRWVYQKYGDVHHRRMAQSEPLMPRFKLVDFGPVIKTEDISILAVISLPGLELIYGGFGLLMMGLILSFYVFHKRIWILVDKKSGKLQVGGKCNKQVRSFDSEMEEVFKIASTRGGQIYE